MSFHHSNRRNLDIYVMSNGKVSTAEAANNDLGFAIHGLTMYLCWSILSIVQLFLNRYLRHYWRWKQGAHTIIGILSLCLTAYAVYQAYSSSHFHFGHSVHAYAGLITCGLILVMAFLGLVSCVMRTHCCNMDWKSPRLVCFTKLHRYLAFAIIIGSQATVSFGINNYYTYDN